MILCLLEVGFGFEYEIVDTKVDVVVILRMLWLLEFFTETSSYYIVKFQVPLADIKVKTTFTRLN
jgi:hypothetical protein